MSLFLALVAGMFVPLSNLCARKSVDLSGSAKPFFLFQQGSSFLFALFMGPVIKGDFSIPLSTALFGIFAGLVLSAMLFCLGRSVEKGPPGFTFAILNSATVAPGLIMALLFGAALGFSYKSWHAIGSILVLAGLFWGGKGLQGMKEMKRWLLFATATFVFHTILLMLYQWRAMLLNQPHPEEIYSFFTAEQIHSEWFTPFMFLTCSSILLFNYLRSGGKRPMSGEVFYGTCGGLFNQLLTFFIIWATEIASPLENAIIYPIFSVVGIVLTNLWGQMLYQEKVNWRACNLSVFGLIVGTVDWRAVSSVFG